MDGCGIGRHQRVELPETVDKIAPLEPRGQLTGFGVRVRKSGRKNYVLQTRVDGKLRWFTIGQHGRVTVDEARAAALEILAATKKGIDPRDANAKREAEPVMAELGRRFLEEYVPVHCKPSTQGEYRRSVALFIDPAIGDMRISEVQRKDIAKLHHDMRDKPYQANRTLGVLSKMFSLAEVWGLRPDGSNPCRHVKRYKERNRERFLSPEETERLGEWNGRLPPLMPAVGRVEVDPHGPTASKCQGGRFGVFPGKPEGPR